MSLRSLTFHPTSPVTNNHHHHVIPRSNLLSHRQQKTQTCFNSTITTPLTHFITSQISPANYQKTTICATRPTAGPMSRNPESKKMRKGGSWLQETNLLWFVGMLVLAAFAPFAYDRDAVIVAVVLFFLSGFSMTLGYHRLLSHRSFKVPKWLEYFFAYCGLHAIQRDPIFWVSAHKLHHKYSDTEMDPYTPTQGVWFSHIGWFLYNDYIATKCGESPNVSKLKAQGFYRFLQDTYFWHPTALAALLYLHGGFPYLAWGMGVRIMGLHLLTYIPFFVVHKWGQRAWNTPDTSVNNWWVSLLCLGEGWHNNHHAFPRSARHGLEWWQLDFTWELIKFLEIVGLATDVNYPSETDKRRMASLGSNRQINDVYKS